MPGDEVVRTGAGTVLRLPPAPVGRDPYRPGAWRSILGGYREIMRETLARRAAVIAEPSSRGMALLVDRNLAALDLVRAAGARGGLL